MSGDSFAGDEYLAAIAQIEGDRERACRHTAKLVDGAPPGSEGVMASWRSMLARDLCYLGRFDEAEPLLEEARAVDSGPAERTLVATVEALLLAGRGELDQAEERARAAVAIAETRRTTSGSRVGATRTSRWCSSARAGSTRRGTRSSARWPSGSGSAACPSSSRPRADRLARAGAGLTTAQGTFPHTRAPGAHLAGAAATGRVVPAGG